MDIFSVLSLLGGLALFLFGMSVMGDGLEMMAGSRLKTILEKLTESPIRGFFLGLVVTAVIQSSSATTVMLVGFVNSGIMKLSQAIGVIMGANVGTTVTSWILSLTGIQGDGILMKLLKPSSFSPLLAFVGIALHMFAKSAKKKEVGTVLLGFSVLMYGMEAMSNAVTPLADMPAFTNALLLFSNPILGVLAGALITGVIQSSSASVGILQALSMTGSVTFGTAIPIILGQNIGTCITALLSSVGANKNARRVAIVHLYFNVIGTVVFLILFYTLNLAIGFSFVSAPVTPVGIAVVHTIFNVLSTAIMLPFVRLLEKLAYLTIPGDKGETERFQMLDERLFVTPPVAIERCMKMTAQMALIAKEAMETAIALTWSYDEKGAKAIMDAEEQIDTYEDKLGTYLVKLSSQSLSMRDSRQISKLLHTIGEFERIGDHAINTLEVAQEIHEKKVHFSEAARSELSVIAAAVNEILRLAIDAFINDDMEAAKHVEPLEEVIDYLSGTLKNRHIKRLQEGKCTIEMGFIFTDLLTNFERTGDHCSNIAVCVIEIANNSFETHEYLNAIKSSDTGDFKRQYQVYSEKYSLN